MEQSTILPNPDEVATISLHERGEERFIEFVNVTRLDIVVPAIFVAIVVFFFVGDATHLLPSGLSIVVTQAIVYFICLWLVIFPHRAHFVELLRGDLNTRGVWIYGLVPIAIMFSILGLVAGLLSALTHEPIRQLAPNLVFHRRDIAGVLFAPFGEEIVFRVWLQTRLQQGLGRVGELFGGARLRAWFSAAGAFLCGLLFLANHANGFEAWSIYAGAALFTWLRYRHGSLGATLIAHTGWNAALLLLGILIITHVLK